MITISNKLTKEDYIALKDLYNLFFQEATESNALSASLKTIYSLKRNKNNPNINFLIVKDNNKPIGFLKAKTYSDGIGLICHIFIHPDYRATFIESNGQKELIAQKLFKESITWLKQKNCHTIEIETYKKNEHLLNFEQKHLGFTIIDEFPDSYVLQGKVGELDERHFNR